MFRRIAVTAAVVAGAAALGMGTANADEWPTPPPYPSPLAPTEVTGFLTPQDPDYWNPLVSQNRLTSPYGNSTRIVCEGFHGVLLDCWQADAESNPHKLIKLNMNYPGSAGQTLPGGGPGHFVYPGYIPGIG
ncbi:MAG: hypothetical protein U5N21_16975 [Rhodococcus sp. (in: high G+C Gram-positive bacteria)]|uniref:hypothetical protein n=1 Tax=Rhodococcus sp. TaxID=1831 RepID=UPI002ADAEC5C|nr:hypothetical protein [Rhodococcus sp. (in: high G+C Gram-positive bacteria)]MDZ7931642.1 hypothetical protein [Rhodococcus sp. (in: high G+C Gram-positive bacteria)]